MEVKQLKLEEKPLLLAFLQRFYGTESRHGDERFWDWHFLEAPFSDPSNLPVWVAIEGERVGGLLAAIEVRLNVDGQPRRAIWILDLLVDPDFRRRGLGKKLALEALAFCPLVLGVNTAAQHSTALLEALGWTMVQNIPRYHAMLLPGEAVKEIGGIAPLRWAANAIYLPFRPGKAVVGDVRKIDKFDEVFNRLSSKVRDQWRCSVERSRELLTWQYRDQPGKQFNIIGSFRDGELVGYAVIFVRKPNEHGAIQKAAISDISYLADGAEQIIDDLIHSSLALALEKRAGSLVTDIVDPLIEKRLKAAGFRAVKSPLQLLVKTDRDADVLCSPASWFVTRGDSDTSIFEEPNI